MYVTVVVRQIHVWSAHNNIEGKVTTLVGHIALSSQGTATPVIFRIFISLYNTLQLRSHSIGIFISQVMTFANGSEESLTFQPV